MPTGSGRSQISRAVNWNPPMLFSRSATASLTINNKFNRILTEFNTTVLGSFGFYKFCHNNVVFDRNCKLNKYDSFKLVREYHSIWF